MIHFTLRVALMKSPSLQAPSVDPGSRVIVFGVSAHHSKLYLLRSRTRAILASSMANLMPMQFRGPCPNPKKENLKRDCMKSQSAVLVGVGLMREPYGCLLALFSSLKFSGLNCSGLGYISGSLWMPPALIKTSSPFLMMMSVPGIL